MADLTVTATSVQPGAGADLRFGIAAATITAGMALYKSSTDAYGRDVLSPAINTSVAAANAVGIAMGGAAAGQGVVYQKSGPYTVGATIVAGEVYGVGAAGGGIAIHTDLGAGEAGTQLFVGLTTTTAQLAITPATVLHT